MGQVKGCSSVEEDEVQTAVDDAEIVAAVAVVVKMLVEAGDGDAALLDDGGDYGCFSNWPFAHS